MSEIVKEVEGSIVEPQFAIPFSLASSIPCIGIRWKEGALVVAVPDEKRDEAQSALSGLDFKYEFVPADESDIRDLQSLILGENGEQRIESFAAITGDAPISQLVEELLNRAVSNRASDLHIEPFENYIDVRIRVDGRLKSLVNLPITIGPAISSRIKILSQLNIVERRRPQDGQFTTMINDRRVDVRVATTATLHGEKIVMRLHDERTPLVSLSQLGMPDYQYKPFSRAVLANNGLVLAAGPTGSGKTTTLHSALRATSSPEKNVTTIEDPVEYVVPGINQIPVSEATGTGFATQLRAILRQDPDVILVGETRDAETARISVQASLTGHLVLSSIHATDAVGAVYRLMQMDIEPYLVASSLTMVISQRLVRRICNYCREEYLPSHSEKLLMEEHQMSASTLWKGAGCAFCGGSGYRSRIAAYQVLEINERLSELISTRPDPVEFRRAATEEGMSTIARQALELATQGKTTIAEAMELLNYVE